MSERVLIMALRYGSSPRIQGNLIDVVNQLCAASGILLLVQCNNSRFVQTSDSHGHINTPFPTLFSGRKHIEGFHACAHFSLVTYYIS
jgi:hypothetical protein